MLYRHKKKSLKGYEVFTDEQKSNNMPEHIAYDKVLAVGSLDAFINCSVSDVMEYISDEISSDA